MMWMLCSKDAGRCQPSCRDCASKQTGEIHTVQAKARGNTESVLTANKDHISNFVAHSHSKFGGDSKVKYMTIFTTANDLHNVTREMYNDEVRVIGNNDLRKLLDNNDMFWTVFRESLIYGDS